MPVPRYGVLKGRALARRPATDLDLHYHLLVAANVPYRVAINVQSQSLPSVLEYMIDTDWAHPVCAWLPDLPLGFTPIAGRGSALALDYVRGNLFDPLRLRLLPYDLPGPDNDLNEALDRHVEHAIADATAHVYAFGSRWGPERRRDAVFGFRPTNGVHNVHMNQRNSAGFARQEGAWQDGALILHLPSEQRWIAIFLKFQSQSLAAGADEGPRAAAGWQPGRPRFVPTARRHRRRF